VRIAFFGLPLAACLLHADGHEIAYAGISRPESLGLRRLKRLVGESNVELKPNAASPKTLARVRAANPDVVVSWFWTTRLPTTVVSVGKLPGFGVHPSLLPRHRGPDPYFWAIESGDAETGVTAHELAAEYDTGAILGRESLAIDPSWNAWTLARRLDRPSLRLLRKVALAYARGQRPVAVPQNDQAATVAPQPTDDELEIDWTWPTDRILRRVRAASPWPGAWSFFGDEAIAVTRAEPADSFPRALAAGEATVVKDVAVVRTGDGAVALLGGRMDAAEGEEPHTLDADDWRALVGELGKEPRES
jgi:methionyl-tRNA formyltransferase